MAPHWYYLDKWFHFVNPKMDMQKIVTLDGFAVADPREHFVKIATLNKNI